MATEYVVGTENNRLDEVTADAGATAWFQTWDGALPATPASAPAGTLLASCAMSNPIAPAASGGVLTMSAITDDSNADAAGTPTFCRIATSETGTTTGIVQIDAAVGSGSVNFSAAISAGATVSIAASGTITHG